MEYREDFSGAANPIVRDMPVYDGALLNMGEMLMKGTTDPDTDTDEGICLVTAYSATCASQAVDSVGILCERTYQTGGTAPTNYWSPTTANIAYQAYYGKVVVNPFAVYWAEYYQGTSDDTAITSTATTTLTIASVVDEKYAGGWMYFPLTQTGVKYYLRFIVANATGSMTMDSALDATGGATDTVIWLERIHNYPADMSDDALGLSSAAFAGAENGATNIVVIDNIMQSAIQRPARLGASSVRGASRGHEKNCRGLGPLDSTTKFYAEVIFIDKLFDQE